MVFCMRFILTFLALMLAASAQPATAEPSPASDASAPAAQAAPDATTPAPPAAAAPAETPPPAHAKPGAPGEMTIETFLDRLMLAESGGHDLDVNPRSTAAGPFQFIVSTFLEVARRNFAAEVASLSPPQLLKLRFDRAFARKAAKAYTQENADRLAAAGLQPTFPRLRLAHLVGPGAAIRLLRVPPETRAAMVLGPKVIHANPFMAPLTAGTLLARAARDLEVHPETTAGIAGRAGKGNRGKKREGLNVAVRCNLQLAPCRRWLALAERRLLKAAAQKETAAGR
jgi:hypothetical protein